VPRAAPQTYRSKIEDKPSRNRKTTVPTGATTGPVQVVTPSGTLTSNVNFQIEP
jgi:hypothetical protein